VPSTGNINQGNAEPSTRATATAAAGSSATLLDALRGLGFAEQPPHPHVPGATFLHRGGDRVIRVYCYPDELAEPDDDNCYVTIDCSDQGGYRDLWQARFDHVGALPLALLLLRTAVSDPDQATSHAGT
jgi:hypothetical protein